MGRSDPYIFDEYLKFLTSEQVRLNESARVAFLGFQGHNDLTMAIRAKEADFYDLALGNWDINSDWELQHRDYDMIVSTRCPYFAKDPADFYARCKSHVRLGGFIFLDWGLGDHWRFEKFKIG